MVFSSLTFLLYFLPITLTGYYLLPKAARNYWLLVLSLLFYAWGAHSFVLVMLGSILLNYLFALAIDRAGSAAVRKWILAGAAALNLGVLFYNKYMNFTTGLLNRYVSSSIPVTSIVLPIGISFFTFQALSYVIDVYRRDTPAQKNPYYVGLYIAFFPQLVAGPIVRYTTIEDQIENRAMSMEKFRSGVTRFMIGFSQKILLSNTFSVTADAAFAQCAAAPEGLSVGLAWLGAICYSLQILFDFSGYSSMAIGLGQMFGFEFLENFNYPYICKTITDFWRRWHISLSQFFRDYVYFPLGGSRVSSKWKLVRNLFVVWLLTGIWHGANFTFLFWGLWYFVLLCFEKVSGLAKKQLTGPGKVLYRIATLVCVILGWVLFRAENLSQAWSYCCAMFGAAGNPLWDSLALRYLNDYKGMLCAGILCATPVFRWIQSRLEERFGLGQAVALVYDLGLLGCVLLSVSSLVMGVNNPFIYFNF